MTIAPERRIYLINVADLLRRAGSHRDIEFVAPVTSIAIVDSAVPDGAEARVRLKLESLSDGLTVTGTVGAAWRGDCRRCLEPAEGVLCADVREVYSSHPQSDDIWPLHGEQLDLHDLVVEALTLELPLAPLCRPSCRGLCPVCGVNRNDGDCGHRGAAGDPRWAALESARFPDRDPEG